MVCVVGKACPGIKVRTGAYVAAFSALFLAACLIVTTILALVYTNVEPDVDRRMNPVKLEMVECYFGAGFAIWGVWAMFTIVLLFGIMVENKRALGLWLLFTAIIPVYFVCGLIFLVVIDSVRDWVVPYVVVQAVNLLALVWICLAIWVYLEEVKKRDKNPELRENEMMFAQPFMGAMPPAGSYNPGYGAPSGGSMSSIPRSQKSRHTYAPTEAGESVRTVPRQSRFDQYKAQLVDPEPTKQDLSGEREGGTTYHRYQYNPDQRKAPNGSSFHGSQGSLSSRPVQPPQYQPARYQRPDPSSHGRVRGSQGSLGGRQPYQPQSQLHASQGSLGGRQGYVPRHYNSQGSLGGRPQYQLQAQDPQESKDSEV
ncbi:uncharacterized protein [Watersipora subatra]|uniref:uncharacterized protein isoform X2 n=1 Tax=Watersipora subatra TaxID=2589382 RepID=UPI00355C4D33